MKIWDPETGQYEDILALEGAKGDKGDPGEQGIQGVPGADGAPGKSAYQSAQDGDYTGTEAQFNSALAGVGNKENKGKITISGVEKTANTHTVTIVTNGVTTNLTLVGVS